MYAEISFDTAKENLFVTGLLGKMFPGSNLLQAYNASQLRNAFSSATFAFGVRNVSVNILVYFVGRTITICLENSLNPGDVMVLKKLVDEYYDKFRDAFNRENIKLANSTAYITISGTRVFGERRTRVEAVMEELKSNWKDFGLSVAGLGSIWIFTYKGIISRNEGLEKARDWALSFGPVSFMLIISLVVLVVTKRSQKKFNFIL